MTAFPTRGQKAPAFWDEQLKAYIDEQAVTSYEDLDDKPTIPNSPDDIGAEAAGTASTLFEQAIERESHTGEQAISTVTDLQDELDNRQMLDAALTAIAALDFTDGDKLPYISEPGAYALTDLTALGRGIIGAEDDTALRTSLGLDNVVYGTDPGIVLIVSEVDPGPLDPGQVWIAPSDIMLTKDIFTQEGQIAVGGVVDGAFTMLPPGTEGQVLTARPTTGSPVEWDDLPAPSGGSGGGKLINTVVPNPIVATAVNTTTETTLATLPVTVADVAAGDQLEFDIAWDWFNNSGAAVTFQWRFKLGATTVMSTPAFSTGSNANRNKGHAHGVINLRTLADQRWAVFVSNMINNANLMGTFASSASAEGAGQSTEDLSTLKNLVVTVQMGTAHASADVKLLAASLKRIR